MSWILRTITDAQLVLACSEATSFRQVAIKFGIRGGSGFAAIKRRIENSDIDTTHFTGMSWNRGLTKEQHPVIALQAKQTSIRMKGKPGHPHTVMSRQKISRSASGRSFGNNARVKWYEVLNPSTNCLVKVQGTWEKRYAEWLNVQNVKWERPETTFGWRLSNENIEHTYHPDFYLPDLFTYIDIKGYMWKDERKQINDELKLRLVQEQNPNLKLTVLMKAELMLMGVL